MDYYITYLKSQGQWDPNRILISDIDSVSAEQYKKEKYDRYMRNVTADAYGLAWVLGYYGDQIVAKYPEVVIPENVSAQEVIYFYENYGVDGYFSWTNPRASEKIYEVLTSSVDDLGNVYWQTEDPRGPYGGQEGEFGMFVFGIFTKSWHCANNMKDFTVIFTPEKYQAENLPEDAPCPEQENTDNTVYQEPESNNCDCNCDPVVINNYYGGSDQVSCGPSYGLSWGVSIGWTYYPVVPQPVVYPIYDYQIISETFTYYEYITETHTVIDSTMVTVYDSISIVVYDTVTYYDTVTVFSDTIDDPNGDGDTIDDPNGDTDTIGDIPNRLKNPERALKEAREKKLKREAEKKEGGKSTTATSDTKGGENKKNTPGKPKSYGELKADLNQLTAGNSAVDDPSLPDPKPDKPKGFGELKADLASLQSANTNSVSTPEQNNVEIGIDKNVTGDKGLTADNPVTTTTEVPSIKVVKYYTPAEAVDGNTNNNGTSSDAGVVKGNGKTNTSDVNPVLESGSTTATFNTGGNQPSGSSSNDWSVYNMPSKGNIDMTTTTTGTNTAGQENSQSTGKVFTTTTKSDLFIDKSTGSFETPSASFQTNDASRFIDRGSKTNFAENNNSAGNGANTISSSSFETPEVRDQDVKPTPTGGSVLSPGPKTVRDQSQNKRKGN